MQNVYLKRKYICNVTVYKQWILLLECFEELQILYKVMKEKVGGYMLMCPRKSLCT